ncbi:hypothetical protein GQ464_007725 [Rhodocaloribacter litoris]|uniref:hypothetical protein n=1 Tax=Rhodocaloribacter litoris TaxID=2558931 RepID=UPI00142003C0|nr:hypothetical protein [Rhodocaloribacter litoris]QXD16816.1 hypothetical protein GQ464_007725 [Rhodocaloribacter litoris]GIV60547.1 MAG: hypothetical protein KatS3mg043_1636 [Rhodothermaceae bacterium]
MPSSRNAALVRIGGWFALIVAAMQVAGNGLHPPIPADTDAALTLIAGTGRWPVIHVIITVSYFAFIPFVLGVAASFPAPGWPVRIGTVFVIAGAAIGAVQILTHLTLFRFVAEVYVSGEAALRSEAVLLYETFWPYSTGLEVAHLVLIFVAVGLFGVAMLRTPRYRRWIALLGLFAGGVATAGVLVGKFVVHGATGGLIFGLSLLPLIVWIVAVGIVLIRARPAPAF